MPDAHGAHDTDSATATKPAAHGVHDDAPASACVSWPAPHAVQFVLPAPVENQPRTHGTHTLLSVASVTFADVPGEQSTHCDRSKASYEPGRHCVHALEPGSAAQPVAHGWHVVESSAPTTVENLPAWHGAHCASVVSVYEPALHSAQLLEPAGATAPALHAEHPVAPSSTPVAYPVPHVRHADEPAAGAYWPAAHGAHVALLTAPTAPLAVPAGHASHTAASGDTNAPAWHCEHALEPACAT